jgi:hypothetical protein
MAFLLCKNETIAYIYNCIFQTTMKACKGKSRVQTQDTGKFRTNDKDQFYTRKSVAKQCVNTITQTVKKWDSYTWLEPAAGSGAFLNLVPKGCQKIGIDIDPKRQDIVKADFLEWSPPSKNNPDHPTKFILFGNPPFGRQSSLAKSFIARGSQFADIIAFILPRSFVKPSMSNIFPLKFHCNYSKELDENSFRVNGKLYDVPCVFQIWQRMKIDRFIPVKAKECGFKYVKNTDVYHVAFRRVGVFAGRCYVHSDNDVFSKQSHYFLIFDDNAVPHIDKIVEHINNHTFPTNTVGPRSISKPEANEVINSIIAKFATLTQNTRVSKERQKHGFTWEKDILTKVYKLSDVDQEKISYTNKLDLPQQMNKIDNCNVSIKTTKSPNCICMADCLSLYDLVSSGEPFHLTIVFYAQFDKIKRLVEIVEIDLTGSADILFGKLRRTQLEKLDALVKSVPQKRKPTPEEHKAMYLLKNDLQKNSGAIYLNIKCNSQQSRLQCSFNKFKIYLKQNPDRVVYKSKDGIFRGKHIIEEISYG